MLSRKGVASALKTGGSYLTGVTGKGPVEVRLESMGLGLLWLVDFLELFYTPLGELRSFEKSLQSVRVLAEVSLVLYESLVCPADTSRVLFYLFEILLDAYASFEASKHTSDRGEPSYKISPTKCEPHRVGKTLYKQMYRSTHLNCESMNCELLNFLCGSGRFTWQRVKQTTRDIYTIHR